MEKFPLPSQAEKPITDFEEIREQALKQVFAYETPEHFIDHGGAGWVYELPQGYCLKVMENRHISPNRHLFDLGNSPRVEAVYLERMSHVQYEGKTRTPKFFGVIDSSSSEVKSAIIMERLDAENVQHILNGTASLPEQFDLETFFNDLEGFISKMHETHKLTHGDLYARNIMIDRQTGEPRLIDFGRAKPLAGLPTAKANALCNEDFDRLNEVYEALKALQNK